MSIHGSIGGNISNALFDLDLSYSEEVPHARFLATDSPSPTSNPVQLTALAIPLGMYFSPRELVSVPPKWAICPGSPSIDHVI
jgi:hypothetical protein